MTLIRNRSFSNRRQAVEFLLRDQQIRVRPEVADWFSYARFYFSLSELEEKSQKLIAKQVRGIYPYDADYLSTLEYITVPYYKFVTSGLPNYYDFSIDLCLLASVEVEWTRQHRPYSEKCVVIELIKKNVEAFKLPLNFLEAVSKNDLKQFKQTERDNRGYFTWHIPSYKLDVKIHSEFLRSLENVFRGKPLGHTLVDYGLAKLEEVQLAEQSLVIPPSAEGVLANKETLMHERKKHEVDDET